MPFKQQEKPDYGSIWVEGPPNTGKSYSIRTCHKPVGIISLPGEKGHSSLPSGEGIFKYVWEDDGTPTKDRGTLYYQKIWRAVEDQTIDLINGKTHGPIQTLFIDGVHKLYSIGLAIATDGESERLQSAFTTTMNERGKEVLVGEFDPRCYGKSHKLIFEYVNLVASSKVPYRIFTSWSEKEKDDPDDTSRNAASHQMPDLPGKAARRVLGEVAVTLHAMIDNTGKYVWQTKPGGKVYGAGIKGASEVVAKVPQFIPQDFQVLAKYLDEVF